VFREALYHEVHICGLLVIQMGMRCQDPTRRKFLSLQYNRISKGRELATQTAPFSHTCICVVFVVIVGKKNIVSCAARLFGEMLILYVREPNHGAVENYLKR
jgi:hypothetical protein